MTRVTSCLLVLACVLLGGCRLDAAVDVVVDADGGGTFAVALTTDQQLRAAATRAGADPLADLERAVRDLRGWSARRAETADGGETLELTADFDDPADLERLTAEFADGLAGPELAPLGRLRMSLTDDTVTLSGSAGLSVTDAVTEMGITQRRARRQLAEALRYRITVHMPGEIQRSNADGRPDDTTAVWTLAAGEDRILQVASARPWTLSRVLGLVTTRPGIIVLLTILASVSVVLWRHRPARRPAADEDAAERTDDDAADHEPEPEDAPEPVPARDGASEPVPATEREPEPEQDEEPASERESEREHAAAPEGEPEHGQDEEPEPDGESAPAPASGDAPERTPAGGPGDRPAPT